MDINTVAAGGGSKLSYYNGIFKVGPESVKKIKNKITNFLFKYKKIIKNYKFYHSSHF